MQPEKRDKEPDPTLSFHLMKFAVQGFQKNTCELSSEEYDQVKHLAREEMLLHQLILHSEEACCVVVPEANLQRTVREVIAEYPDELCFHATLQENNLQFPDYIMALHNDLRVETVLATIGSTVQPVSILEIVHHYHDNKADYVRPEQRSAAHIKISSRPSPSDGTDPARQIIADIRQRVQLHPQSFGQEAKIHSECSTRKQGGRLGKVASGELCPELDTILFSLAAGEISPIIETPDGFHILQCRKIFPGKRLSFSEAAPVISKYLIKEKQLQACRSWLQTLVERVKTDKQ
ncbi:MAG: peptidylprolyl isomerase [Thermodesulfobacteriota bacterium]